jgi:hypothetical protein
MPHDFHMRVHLGILLITVPLGLASAAAVSESRQGGEAGVLRVTTDTREYCDSLAQEVTTRRAGAAAAEAVALAEEGQRMCANGLVRSGVQRVRRALLILRGQS